MSEGFTEISLEKLKTPQGMAELNRMLQQLYDNVAGDANTVRVFKGHGSPEGQISASVGSLYQRLDGGSNTTIYVKESGTDATGWIAK